MDPHRLKILGVIVTCYARVKSQMQVSDCEHHLGKGLLPFNEDCELLRAISAIEFGLIFY